MLTRKDAMRIAAELNLPEPLQKVARGETLEPKLNIHWGNAEEFFISSAKSSEPIGENKILPLWDDGNFDKIYAVHLPTKKFVEFYIEEDVDPDKIQLWNYQQILLPTFQSAYEVYIDDGDEKCRSELIYQAELFDFKYVEELFEIAERNSDDYDKLNRELDELREKMR